MISLTTLLASIPSPPSGTLEIGPLNLRAYGVMIALGVVAAVWLCGRLLEQKGIGTTDDASAAALWGVGAGIIGARLYHVATEWSSFSDDLGSIPKIWEGGLGIPGGLLAGVVAGLWAATRRGIPPAMMLTCAAPAIPLAQAIGRWGNWFNQELFGRPTDLPWALEIDDAHNLGYPEGTTFHPTFLYESLWNLGLVVVLLWVDRKLRLGPGRLFGVYLIGYGIGRFWIEGLRIDPTEASDVFGLRWNQWVALAAVVGGAIYLFVTRGQTWPPADATDDEATDDEATDDEATDDDATDDKATDDEVTDEHVAAAASGGHEADDTDPADVGRHTGVSPPDSAG